MRRHQLDFYYEPIVDGDGTGLGMIPAVVSCIGLSVGIIGAIPPFSGMWTVYLMVISVLVFIGNIVLSKTHLNRVLNSRQVDLWDLYRELSPEAQARIGLDIKTLQEMDNSNEWYDFQEEVNQLALVERQRFIKTGKASTVRQALKSELDIAQKELELL